MATNYIGVYSRSYGPYQPAGPGPTTPDAPTVVYGSAARLLSASHPLDGSLVYRYRGGAFVAYTATLAVDTAAHPVADWQFKRLASAGYAESALASSPQIAARPGGISQPAPTEVRANDSTKRVSFVRRQQAPPQAFRWDLSDDNLRGMQSLVTPNNTDTSFLAGRQNAPAGLLRVCEVDEAGVRISPWALCQDALTTAQEQAFLDYDGNSWAAESGYLSRFSVRQHVNNQTFADSRLLAMLAGAGDNTLAVNYGRSGIVWDEINAQAPAQITTIGNNYAEIELRGFILDEGINSFYKAKKSSAEIIAYYRNYLSLVRASPNNAVYKYPQLQFMASPGDVAQQTYDDGSAFGAETYRQVVDAVNAAMPAIAQEYGITFINLAACPYVGQDGAALRGLKNNEYRDVKHGGVDTKFPVQIGTESSGELVFLARRVKEWLAQRTNLVPDDAGEVSMVVGTGSVHADDQNTIAIQHSSLWPWEYTHEDFGTSRQMAARRYVDNGTYTVQARNVAEPSLTRTLTVTVNAPYSLETVAHARRASAPLRDYALNIRQDRYEPLTAYLVANDLLTGTLTACNGGTGTAGPLGERSGDGDLLVSRWCSLTGADVTAWDATRQPRFLADSATLDANGGLRLAQALSGTYTALIKYENVTGSFRSIGSLLGTPYSLETDGSGAQLYLLNNSTGAAATGMVAFPAGAQTVMLQQAGGTLMLSVVGLPGSVSMPSTTATGLSIGNAVVDGTAVRAGGSTLHGLYLAAGSLPAGAATAISQLL